MDQQTLMQTGKTISPKKMTTPGKAGRVRGGTRYKGADRNA